VLLQLLILASVTSFVCGQIHFGNFFYFFVLHNGYGVVVDDLDFGIIGVAFIQRCSIVMAPLIKLQIGS
jgi:hypothetical protein